MKLFTVPTIRTSPKKNLRKLPKQRIQNSEEWDRLTHGKWVLVKFYEPGSRNSVAIKPAWDRLMTEFEGSADRFVSEVDCTIQGTRDLCSYIGIQSLPSVKYGNPTDLNDYHGGEESTFKARKLHFQYGPLKQFANQLCPYSIEICDDKTKMMQESNFGDLIENFIDELDDSVKQLAKQVSDADKTTDREIQQLENDIQQLEQL
jgi:hypothetical protein